MKVLLAHPGTQHAAYLARELDARGLLGAFYTSIALREDGLVQRFVSSGFRSAACRLLRNRVIRGIPFSRVRTNPWHELRAQWQIRQGRDPVEVLHERNRRFQESIDERSLLESDAVIGFDTSSWILAERCKKIGIPFWLERTISHPSQWHQAQEILHLRHPRWQDLPLPRFSRLVEAEEREHRLAHRVVVGSSFVAQTMEAMGVDRSRLVVNPYGVSWGTFESWASGDRRRTPTSRPVRFLFAGSIGARKGVPVLLEAWERLNWPETEAELWLVGQAPESILKLIPRNTGIRLVGQVAKADMPAMYRDCDIFVLPSFSEGFPLVLLEALAAGLPIITTPNTGAGDLLDHGAAGCVALVEAGSVTTLAAAMKVWKDRPPGRDAIQAACDRLRIRYSWEAYGDRWEVLLQNQG